jgi:hypothetical protein
MSSDWAWGKLCRVVDTGSGLGVGGRNRSVAVDERASNRAHRPESGPSRGFAFAALVLFFSACGGRHALQPGSGRTGDASAGDVDFASDGNLVSDAREDTRRCTFAGFAPTVSYAITVGPVAIVAVDLAGNGHPDLLVGGRGYNGPVSEILANAGDGTFVQSAAPGADSLNVGNMVVADFNGDGKVDLASQSDDVNGIDFGTGNGVLAIHFGTGNRAFASPLLSYTTPQSYGDLALGDFNGDGHPDLAFAGYNYVETGGSIDSKGGVGLPGPKPTDFALNVFFNAGDGTFGAPVTYANPHSFQGIATGDFDGDGHIDIAQLTSTKPGGLDVFFNAGDGTFRSAVTYVAGAGLAVADFNGDGKDDIATATTLNPNTPGQVMVLQVFTGAANGSLNGPVNYPIVNAPSVSQIVTGDFNGDGKPDLAMVVGDDPSRRPILSTSVSVFENLGDGTFSAPVIYSAGGQAGEFATAIAAGDFNGDGVTDIAVGMYCDVLPCNLAVNVLSSKCE